MSSFERAKKPIATLCHGPWVLASSGLLKGRVLTSWPGIRDEVINAGGIRLDQPVVRDGNLLTSRGPQDFAQFVPALLAFFGEPASGMVSHPSNAQAHSSPQRAEAPSVVLGTMRWMPRPSLRGFALGVVVGGLSMLVQRACDRSSQGMRLPIESAAVG